MRYSDIYRPPAPVGGSGGGGSSYIPDPGAVDDFGGAPNPYQQRRNEYRNARVAALRSNPMFRKSKNPIKFEEGYDPKIMEKMLGLQASAITRQQDKYLTKKTGDRPAIENPLPALYKARRDYTL